MRFKFAQIEITTKCNAACVYCDRTISEAQVKAIDIPIGLYQRIIYQLRGLTNLIHLQGVGEPLLNKQLHNMISMAHKMGFRTMSTSNLSMLKHNVLNQLDILYVSLDSIKNGKENLRINISPQKVLNNLLSLLDRSKRPEIHLTTVVSRNNLDQIEEILNLMRSLKNKIKSIVLSPVLDLNNSGFGLSQHDRKVLESIVNLYPDVPVVSSFRLRHNASYCGWLEDKIYITVDGYLTPCCIRSSSNFHFGTLAFSELQEVLQGKELEDFRNNIKNEKFDTICAACVRNGTHTIWQETSE